MEGDRGDGSKRGDNKTLGLSVGKKFSLGLRSCVTYKEWEKVQGNSKVRVSEKAFDMILSTVEAGLMAFEYNFAKVKDLALSNDQVIRNIALPHLSRLLGGLESGQECVGMLSQMVGDAFEKVTGISASTKEAFTALLMGKKELADYHRELQQTVDEIHRLENGR